MEDNLMETERRDDVIAEKPDYAAEIAAIIRSNASPKVTLAKLEDYHETDLAASLSLLQLQERKKLYRVLDSELLSGLFEALDDEEEAGKFLAEMDIKKSAEVISDMETDRAVALLRAVEKERRALIIDAIAPETQKELRLIASFDEDEIGSRVTTNCIIIHANLTVKQAMSELISQAQENDNISTIFVVDENDEFYGAIDLKELIMAHSTTSLESLIYTSFPYVYAGESIDDCIEKIKAYSEAFLPVLDSGNRMLGVITAQSVIDVVDEQLGEDYAKLAGLTAEEDLNEPLFQSLKKRLPWLLALLGLGLIVSSVVGVFEQVVATLPLIMAFQSLILDMAGNVGTQSLAVTIRVLTDETLSFSQKVKLVFKEMRVGLLNGFILGFISFVFVGLYIRFLRGETYLFSFAVSGCLGLSMVLAMLISSLVGTTIPLFFKRIKVDPAVASGPLITTINDLVAVVSYYGLSWILLLQVLHLA